MTDMIDKNLRQFRPRPEARRDDAPGWLGPIAFVGIACTVYTALALVQAVRLMWGW